MSTLHECDYNMFQEDTILVAERIAREDGIAMNRLAGLVCVVMVSCVDSQVYSHQTRAADEAYRFSAGTTLRVVMVKNTPFARYNQSWYNSNQLWDGWLVDVLEHIAGPDMADFDFEIYTASNHSDSITMMQKFMVAQDGSLVQPDIIFSDMYASSETLENLVATAPYSTQPLALLVQVPVRAWMNDGWTYAYPFDASLWWSIVSACMCASVYMIAIEGGYKMNPDFGGDSIRSIKLFWKTISTSIYMTLGTFSGIATWSPVTFPGRLFSIFWVAFAVLVTTSYTANLTAWLIANRPAIEAGKITDFTGVGTSVNQIESERATRLKACVLKEADYVKWLSDTYDEFSDVKYAGNAGFDSNMVPNFVTCSSLAEMLDKLRDGDCDGIIERKHYLEYAVYNAGSISDKYLLHGPQTANECTACKQACRDACNSLSDKGAVPMINTCFGIPQPTVQCQCADSAKTILDSSNPLLTNCVDFKQQSSRMKTKFLISDQLHDEGPMSLVALVNRYQVSAGNSSKFASQSQEIAEKLSYWMTKAAQDAQVGELFKYAVLRGEPPKEDPQLGGAAFREVNTDGYSDGHQFGTENMGSALWLFYGFSAALVALRIIKIVTIKCCRPANEIWHIYAHKAKEYRNYNDEKWDRLHDRLLTKLGAGPDGKYGQKMTEAQKNELRKLDSMLDRWRHPANRDKYVPEILLAEWRVNVELKKELYRPVHLFLKKHRRHMNLTVKDMSIFEYDVATEWELTQKQSDMLATYVNSLRYVNSHLFKFAAHAATAEIKGEIILGKVLNFCRQLMQTNVAAATDMTPIQRVTHQRERQLYEMERDADLLRSDANLILMENEKLKAENAVRSYLSPKTGHLRFFQRLHGKPVPAGGGSSYGRNSSSEYSGWMSNQNQQDEFRNNNQYAEARPGVKGGVNKGGGALYRHGEWVEVDRAGRWTKGQVAEIQHDPSHTGYETYVISYDDGNSHWQDSGVQRHSIRKLQSAASPMQDKNSRPSMENLKRAEPTTAVEPARYIPSGNLDMPQGSVGRKSTYSNRRVSTNLANKMKAFDSTGAVKDGIRGVPHRGSMVKDRYGPNAFHNSNAAPPRQFEDPVLKKGKVVV